MASRPTPTPYPCFPVDSILQDTVHRFKPFLQVSPVQPTNFGQEA